MGTSDNVNDILSKVKTLNIEEQLSLLERLVLLVKKTHKTSTPLIKLTSLGGLGSELWKNTDIDKYLDEERKW
ncbi:MAG: hypothetical protein WBP41_18645 [Saprospiraceae bacterium]